MRPGRLAPAVDQVGRDQRAEEHALGAEERPDQRSCGCSSPVLVAWCVVVRRARRAATSAAAHVDQLGLERPATARRASGRSPTMNATPRCSTRPADEHGHRRARSRAASSEGAGMWIVAVPARLSAARFACPTSASGACRATADRGCGPSGASRSCTRGGGEGIAHSSVARVPRIGPASAPRCEALEQVHDEHEQPRARCTNAPIVDIRF